MTIDNIGSHNITFSIYAVQRMFERGINELDVIRVLADCETIEEYPDDTPFPSMLVFGTIGDTPIHLVIAIDRNTSTIYIITVYKPDPAIWTNGFRTRRSKQ